ncbi:hypothetical protein LIA77_00310 [Sarocladium implicatum]|nr:hypothetical protein LIA77_00310 [Sarocladium implicatum]
MRPPSAIRPIADWLRSLGNRSFLEPGRLQPSIVHRQVLASAGKCWHLARAWLERQGQDRAGATPTATGCTFLLLCLFAPAGASSSFSIFRQGALQQNKYVPCFTLYSSLLIILLSSVQLSLSSWYHGYRFSLIPPHSPLHLLTIGDTAPTQTIEPLNY